jgi:hypothetical protein
VEIYAFNREIHELTLLVNRFLITNYTINSLQAIRKQAERKDKDFIFTDRLLLRNGRLVVPTDGTDKALIIDLIREAYN